MLIMSRVCAEFHDRKGNTVFTIDEKKQLLAEIYGQQLDDMDDSKIEVSFRRIMKREIQDVEMDVEHFS